MSAPFSLPAYFDAREAQRRAFTDSHGLSDYTLSLLYEDMASRRFYRLTKGNDSAVLMDSLPDDHPHATLGHRLHDYIRLAKALRDAGVHAPAIMAADETAGLVLMEDLGDTILPDDRLEQAVDALVALRAAFPANSLALPDYFASHIHAAHRRVVDWYMPCARREKNPQGRVGAYHDIWRDIEASLPQPMRGFVHADFHRGNLRLTGSGCGVLDFQGAQWGPLTYDLVNLLRDARRRITPAREKVLKARYVNGLPDDERAVFDTWYHVLSAQFHLRVSGQFIKLALVGGKRQYLDYLPIVQNYLREDMSYPLLAPLKDWFAAQRIDFSERIDPDTAYIASDAY